MTETAMITLFGERYNLSSNTNDDKQDDEVYLLLNSATNRFIKQRFTGNNSRGIGFEGDQKRRDDLRTLITKSGEITVDVAAIDEIPNGKQYVVPADFMFLIKAYYQVTAGWFSAESIPNSESYKWIETPKNNPIIRQGKLIYETGLNYTIIVDPDLFSGLTTSKLQYIVEPDVIASGTDCNLPDHTHEEIVDMAVGLAVDEYENELRSKTHTEKLERIE